jgi:hypothetical protein
MKGKRSRKQLSRRCASKNPDKGVLRPKIEAAKRRRQSQREIRLKKPGFYGIVSSLAVRG